MLLKKFCSFSSNADRAPQLKAGVRWLPTISRLNTMRYDCPVCGYPDLTEPTRSHGGGSYEICPSCGFQFGVSDDSDGISYDECRESWIDQGMPWNSKGIKPPMNWSPQHQLARVAPE